MTIQQLKYVVEVAARGSLSEAAKSLFVTQPTVSKAVKELEEELGIEIFVRNNKGIGISPEGAEFVSYARQVVQQMELLEERYLDQRRETTFFQVSSLHYSFAAEAFLDVYKEQAVEHYDFRFKESTACRVIREVQERRSELGILYMSEENEGVLGKYLAERHLVFHELFQTCAGVYIRAGHPLADRTGICLEDLEPYPCISTCLEDDESVYMGEELFVNRIIRKNLGITCRGTGIQYLRETDGYTLSPVTSAARIDSMGIVCIPLEESLDIRFGYITPENTQLTPLGKQFIRTLRKKGNSPVITQI